MWLVYGRMEVVASGVLLSDVAKWLGRFTITENVALNRGSSKQGNAFRAWPGSNFDEANHLKLNEKKKSK